MASNGTSQPLAVHMITLIISAMLFQQKQVDHLQVVEAIAARFCDTFNHPGNHPPYERRLLVLKGHFAWIAKQNDIAIAEGMEKYAMAMQPPGGTSKRPALVVQMDLFVFNRYASNIPENLVRPSYSFFPSSQKFEETKAIWPWQRQGDQLSISKELADYYRTGKPVPYKPIEEFLALRKEFGPRKLEGVWLP